MACPTRFVPSTGRAGSGGRAVAISYKPSRNRIINLVIKCRAIHFSTFT